VVEVGRDQQEEPGASRQGQLEKRGYLVLLGPGRLEETMGSPVHLDMEQFLWLWPES
jgi:hypothetical protein